MYDVAPLAAVIVSAVLGLAGLLTPLVTRRGDRLHSHQQHLRERRAEAYACTLRVMSHAQELDEDAVRSEMTEASVLIGLWGSRDVRERFTAWAQALPPSFGPDATDVDRVALSVAAESVRQRMADEVQGRVLVR